MKRSKSASTTSREAGVVQRDQGLWRGFRGHTSAMIGLSLLVTFCVLALLAPWLAPYGTNQTDLNAVLQGPSASHWLGTDDLGRDVLTRMLHATRISLLASGQAVALAVVLGVALGMVSGYIGGWVDTIVMRFIDGVMILPGLLLVMGIVGILGVGLTQAMVGLGVAFTPVFVRLARAEVLAVKERPYIEAARASGIRPTRIVRKHVFPNILSPLIIQIMMVMGYALLAEGALSYLGLSVQPPTPSWGTMLNRAYAFSPVQPWAVLIPGGAIMICVWSFNAIGDALRDLLSAGGGEKA